MKTKLVALLFAFMAATQILSAQTEDGGYKSWKNGLGFSAGYSTGWGMSYRHYFNKFGMQATLGPYVTKDDANVSVGLSFLYDLVKTEKTTFFLYQGNNFMYQKYREYNYDPYTYMETRGKIVKDYNLVHGLGIGYEIVVFERIGLSFMGGYAAGDFFESINFTGEIAALYRF